MGTAVFIHFPVLWTSHIFCFRQSQFIEFLMRVRHSWIRIPEEYWKTSILLTANLYELMKKNKKCEVTAEASYFLTFTALSWQLCRMLQYVLPFYHSWFCSRNPRIESIHWSFLVMEWKCLWKWFHQTFSWLYNGYSAFSGNFISKICSFYMNIIYSRS